jgi:hypothetical protein
MSGTASIQKNFLIDPNDSEDNIKATLREIEQAIRASQLLQLTILVAASTEEKNQERVWTLPQRQFFTELQKANPTIGGLENWAKILGLCRSMISRLFTGDARATPATLKKIITAQERGKLVLNENLFDQMEQLEKIKLHRFV